MLIVYLGGILMIDISKLIKAEYEYIRFNANFTERELELYELRNKQYTYEMCAELMNMSDGAGRLPRYSSGQWPHEAWLPRPRSDPSPGCRG